MALLRLFQQLDSAWHLARVAEHHCQEMYRPWLLRADFWINRQLRQRSDVFSFEGGTESGAQSICIRFLNHFEQLLLAVKPADRLA